MEPEMTPGAYGHLIRDTGGTEYTMEKRQSLHKCCSENWAAPCKRTNLEPSLTPLTNSKRITDLKVRPDTVKLLRGKHRQNTQRNCTKIFFDPPPTVMKIKTTTNK